MKLDLEQIKSITFGALAVRKLDDGYLFERSTQKQIEAWYAVKNDVGARAEYSSGVTLDFHTNSSMLRISASRGDVYDVYVDGLLRASLNMNNFREHCAKIPLTDPLGKPLAEARVTVYLPHGDCPSVISAIELDDGSYVKPHAFDKKFLFLGDSISQGYSAEMPSLSYVHSVSRFFNAECLNQCVGGGILKADTLDDISFEPDTVFIAFGTNDYNHFSSYDDMRNSAHKYFDEVQKRYQAVASHIFVISPIWRDDLDFDRPMGTFEQAREIIIREANEHGMIHIDGLLLVPPIHSLFDDGYLHPNATGFTIYTRELIKQMLNHMHPRSKYEA